MNKSFDASGVQFAWDSTSIKLAETCLRKYYYKMIVGWQPERKSVQALVETWVFPDCETCEGTGHGMEMKCVGGPPFEVEVDCPDCNGEGKLLEGGSPWVSDHNTKTRENLIRTIVWYVDQFGEDDSCSTVILSNGKPAVEHSFRLEADNGIILSGHLDRLVEYGHAPYIQDQKTTGSTISSRYFDGYNPDTQMSLYTFAGRSIFNLQIKGIMIDAAQIAVGFTRFERGFTFRDEGQLNEWYDNSMYHIEKAREATREDYFPLNPSSCGNYGGCEFRHICSKAPSIREQFLKGDFVKGKRWDPLEVR
jgi:hypothetical protein